MLNRKFFTAQKSILIALTFLLMLAMGCKINNEMSANSSKMLQVSMILFMDCSIMQMLYSMFKTLRMSLQH